MLFESLRDALEARDPAGGGGVPRRGSPTASIASTHPFLRGARSGAWRASASSTPRRPITPVVAIGVLTMGLEAGPDVMREAGELVTEMEALGYLQPGEATALPSVRPAPAAIAYGPLDGFPLDPQVVLVTSTPEQAMVLAEAAGAVELNGPALRLHGRPACAAIPRALESARLEVSLGCAGMRTFTAVEPGMLLSVLPAPMLPGLVERLATAASANESMRAHYAEKLG